MGVALAFLGRWRGDPLHVVLAVVLLACGAVTILVARPARGGQGAVDQGRATDTGLVHLDRSALRGEDEDDRRHGIDADQVPTLGALVAWIEQNHYLPPTTEGHWELRHRGRRAARIDCRPEAFTARLLLPAEHPTAPGSHWSIRYEKR
ncbi:hypothetical protein D9T14_07310 [Propionibacterium australiense]|uniref:Uncharacterized protein n=1 Tax=Propionibacterium australiense TaxID=119981 RepID=A0A8B3FRT0_9ACTN|nr:hypothetical protein D9T14_07310 [Propionibacterium australiense]RLP09871.1 hypothetical protein D7U36_06735 [Propionibacterium australiense]